MSAQKWHNLDARLDFDLCCKTLQSGSTRNFTVLFDAATAKSAFDLDHKDIQQLLDGSGKKEPTRETRWFNFWASETDTTAIRAIAGHYGVSPRLTALLCSARSSTSRGPKAAPTEVKIRSSHSSVHCSSQPDVEKAFSHTGFSPKTTVHAAQLPGFGDVVDDLWHFCSVDRGTQYLYVGFNSLFTSPGITGNYDTGSSKPVGLRIWTSILLCQDGTVMSIFEKPPATAEPEYVGIVRFNVLNIFRHLSRLNVPSTLDNLMQVTVRPESGAGEAGTSAVNSDAPALLFYYLFDDWMVTYSLITQRNNPYRTQLELIRQEMFETADMDLIRSLDLVGRQLTVLRLMYQSYELIIHRVLRDWNMHDPLSSIDSSELDKYASANRSGVCQLQSDAGTRMPMSAAIRFERLLDRIRLYALTDIDESLKQKESLVFMIFNLIALKESHAVEKLTRTTVLLAKVTILFLPVSLMTSYFSVQLKEFESVYTLKTYWVCFLVVVVASTLGLVFFGAMTGKVGGRTTYKSMTRTFWDRVRGEKAKRQ